MKLGTPLGHGAAGEPAPVSQVGCRSGSALATPAADTGWAHHVPSSGGAQGSAGMTPFLPLPHALLLSEDMQQCEAGVTLPTGDSGQPATRVCPKLAGGMVGHIPACSASVF